MGASSSDPGTPGAIYDTPYGRVQAPSLEAARKFIETEKAKRQPWVNDAGQTVYPPGAPAPFRQEPGGQEDTQREPWFAMEPPSQNRNLASKIVEGIGSSIPAPGSSYLAHKLGDLVNKVPGFEGRAADLASAVSPYIAGEVPGRIPGGVTAPKPPPVSAAITYPLETRAAGAVSQAFQKGAQGGAPTAIDTLAELNRAKETGQPLTLLDVPNQPLQKLASDIYRRGQTGASLIRSFLEKREAGSVARSEGIINRGISDRPLTATAEDLAQQRSTHAKPVWEEVKRGGSTAPLATQFEQAFQESLRAKEAAMQQVRTANVKLTQARARQSQAGNVYSRSGSNLDQRQAALELRVANEHLERVTQESEAMRTRLQQAVADQTANAPGAVWSPRLQQLLDQPEIKQGIRRGWNIERRRAIGEGRTFNPTEYAIVGFEKNGDPIVGKVPNMALLMVAKEGLDHIIQSPAMRDVLTGRLNKNGASYAALRDGLVQELDRLNPSYKAARNMWSGETQSIDALQAGHAMLGTRRFPQLEDAERYYARLTDSDKEFFKIGVATDLKNRLFRNRAINTEDIKRRLRPLFKSEQEANDFVGALERERFMRQTGAKIRGIAQQPDSASDAAQMALQAAHGVGNLLHGRFIRGTLNALRLKQLLSKRPDEALDHEIAKLLTDTDVALQGNAGATVLPNLPKPGEPGPNGGKIVSAVRYRWPGAPQ